MKLLRLIPLLLFVLPVFGTTYYVSKSSCNSTCSASDSNTSAQAQSKSTPWVHVPGMTGATGNANSYTPVAGDQFILYGGDTWGTSDLPLQMNHNGSGQCVTTPNSNCIYVGVDQTWYNSGVCGGSWCRPIFSQQNTVEAWYAMAYIYGTNITLDNIEFTGMLTSGGNTERIVSLGGGGGNDVIEHCYFHGWNHSASGDVDNSVVITGASPGVIVHDNVIDGADTLAATAVSGNPCGSPDGVCQGMNTGIGGAAQIYNNIIKNVTSGINTSSDIIHDNYIGPVWLGYTGGHRNGIQIGGAVSAAYFLAYNNVMTMVQNGGMGGFWIEQGSSNAGLTAYVFNNVLFAGTGTGAGLGEGMQFCQEPLSGGSCGPFYAFNNTMESQFALSGSMTSSSVANLYNNHCLSSAGDCAANQGSWTVNETTNRIQCRGTGAGCADANLTPHFDQYTETQTYAFSPVASTNSTVGAGTSEASVCTTISGLNAAAGTACLSSTGYSCTYNTGNHTITCPNLALNTRGSTWDQGAYQFTASTQASQPSCNPGTGTYSSTQTVTCTNPNTGTTVMCYTTDGSLPVTNYPTSTACTNGTKYTTTISVAVSETLSVVASTTLLSDSTEAQYVYTISNTISTPTCSPAAGTYNNNQSAVCTIQSGATGCYTLTGTAPTAPTPGTCGGGSTTYSGAITISSTETLEILATEAAFTNSSVASYAYTLQVGAPTFSPVAGTYATAQSVTISTTTTSAVLHYAVNATPTCGSTTYTTPVSVSVSETLEAIGCLSGYSNSNVSSAAYTIGITGIFHVSGGCSSGAHTFFAGTGSGTFACGASTIGDAIVFFLQCHPTSGTISGITLSSPGWTFTQSVAPASTGSNSWGALFTAIAPDTNSDTFTGTFTGASNCTNFSIALTEEFFGNNTTGGSTTFNATGSNSGAASTCNQSAANVTPPLANEAVWNACLLGNATTATAPWTLGATDGVGNSAEWQVLSGGAGVAQTPAFNGSSGAYIVEGVAIAPAGAIAGPTAPSAFMAEVH